MDEPPPVPPKDTPPNPSKEEEELLQRASSASKRKRNVPKRSNRNLNEDQEEDFDLDAHTPKRSRHDERSRELEPSDDDPSTSERNVRRKKGFRNLSNLHLRHAAQKQAERRGKARESKFQEGSLTDKPSEEPPSAYTRLMQTGSGNVENVDVLMEDYHNQVEEGPTRIGAHKTGPVMVESAKENEGGGFFRFGRHWTQTFHPVALWNKMWNESKDELAKEEAEAAERRAKQKSEAEAKYAEMKQAGQLRLQPIGPVHSDIHAFPADLATPRDSGVSVDSSKQGSGSHMRSASAASDLSEFNPFSGNEQPDNAAKTLRGFRSRLHLKTPSFSDIKSGLRRFGSEINLGAAAAQHDSSSSVSPVKGDFDNSTIRRSQSRYDLKKQQKLTKRVSDLEAKLHQARMELDEALVDASPMPSSGNRNERYVPSGTLKRKKFMSAHLPSLPSEGVLMTGGGTTNFADGTRALSPPLAEFDPRPDEDENEETIKARVNHQLRPRLSSLFKDVPNREKAVKADTPIEIHEQKPAQPHSATMDPNSITNDGDNTGVADLKPQASYSDLDAKLKALEKNTKLASKKAKKRKSAADDDGKLFKPDKDTDDDGDWDEADSVPKKKRKSGGAAKKGGKTQAKKGDGDSPQQVRSNKGNKQNAKQSAAEAKSTSTTTGKLPATPTVKDTAVTEDAADATQDATLTAEEQRMSLDSQPLEPLIEEDEETATTGATAAVVTTKIPIKDAPSKPTAKATPARHSHHSSVHSQVGSGVHSEEADLPSLPQIDELNATPQASNANDEGKAVKLNAPSSDDEDPIVLVPGESGVPLLPKGATGSFESLPEAERAGMEVEVLKAGETDHKGTEGKVEGQKWDWPDDVF